MATSLKVSFEDEDFSFLADLRKFFPKMMVGTLGWVGARGRSLLRRRLLSGQELNLSQYPKDKGGRGTTSYTFGGRGTFVKISSYPVNLFERGRKLRSGKKEAGRRIITQKLKSMLNSQMQTMVNQYDRTILQKEVDRIK